MEAFKEAWLAIDTAARGSITTKELTVYMKKQNYDEAFVNKWLRLFDQDGSGTIEVEEFCDVLGLNSTQLMSEAKSRLSSELPAGVEIISTDMEVDWQLTIVRLCIEGMERQELVRDIPKWIKVEADKKLGQIWHVVIINGQFWCYYGHQPGYSVVFRYKRHIFVVFKTPGSV